MPIPFDGRDAWWLFGRPVARLRDIEPLFTPDVMLNIRSYLKSSISIDEKQLRKKLMIIAGDYLFLKQLDANSRPSKVKRESLAFKNVLEKVLDLATNMSAYYHFHLMFASDHILQLARDDKLPEGDDDNYQVNRWLQLVRRHNNSLDLLAASFDGVFHVAMAVDIANDFAEKDKDSTGRVKRHIALMGYVPRLGQIFAEFSGRPPGITYDPYKKMYKGDFFEFVRWNLEAVDREYKITNSALGRVIKRALTQSRRFGELPGRRRAPARTNRDKNPKRLQGHRAPKNRNSG